MGERAPAYVWPVGSFLSEELDARGWTQEDLAFRMGTEAEFPMNLLCVGMLIAVNDSNLILDRETAEALSRALNVSSEFFLNLDRLWRERGPDAANSNKFRAE